MPFRSKKSPVLAIADYDGHESARVGLGRQVLGKAHGQAE
jgi:hypothetical protein